LHAERDIIRRQGSAVVKCYALPNGERVIQIVSADSPTGSDPRDNASSWNWPHKRVVKIGLAILATEVCTNRWVNVTGK